MASKTLPPSPKEIHDVEQEVNQESDDDMTETQGQTAFFTCLDCPCVFSEWIKADKHITDTGHRVQKEKGDGKH